MATMTRERKSVKSAKPFSCSFVSMTIEVNDTRYSVDQTDPGEFGTRSFRLAKRSGNHEIYDLVKTHAGIVECTCPDYESRHRGNGYGMCKHGRALVELGLMAAPLAPEFAPAKGVHTVNALPVVAPAPAPVEVVNPNVIRIDQTLMRPTAPTRDEPDAPAPKTNRNPMTVCPPAPPVEAAPVAPEPCCAPSEAEPCRECVGTFKASMEALNPAPVAACVCSDCQEAAECVAAEAEDMGPAEAWGPEWDIDAWMLGADAPEPEPEPEDLAEAETSARELLNPAGPPTLTLAELVVKQVQFFLSWSTDAGDLIAGQLDQLASRIRFLDARSPAEFTDRCDVLDRDERDGVYRAGFDAGVAHARSVEVAGSAFGHSS